MARIKRMFLGSNSSLGFYSRFEEIFSEDLNRYFIIKGGPGTGKSVFMKNIGKAAEAKDLDIEYYHCSSDSNSLDGLFIEGLNLALVDGTSPHIIEPKYPGLIDDIIDFSLFLKGEKLKPYKDTIIEEMKNSSKYFKKAYINLRQTSSVLEEIELCYLNPIDQNVIYELKEKIFNNKNINIDKSPNVRRFFASAITPTGIHDYYKTLIEDGTRVYNIRGSMGLGTKYILGDILDTSCSLGIDVEVYYCPLRPEDINMIIIPMLNIAVVASTPFLKIDDKDIDSDQIETMDISISSGKISEALEDKFYYFLNLAIEDIVKAKQCHDILEKIYSDAMDFDGVEAILKEMLYKF